MVDHDAAMAELHKIVGDSWAEYTKDHPELAREAFRIPDVIPWDAWKVDDTIAAQHAELVAHWVARVMRTGYGDPTAPLADGERVHARILCPFDELHDVECDWSLVIEWVGPTGMATRYVGMIEQDRLAREHLLTAHHEYPRYAEIIENLTRR